MLFVNSDMGLKLPRGYDKVCTTPAAYKKSSSSGSPSVTFKLPVGAVEGGAIFFYSKGCEIAYGGSFIGARATQAILAHGVIQSISGTTASIGWLRMVHSTNDSMWNIGDLSQGGMDSFREVQLGGPRFQLIPVFRWEAPEAAMDLLDMIGQVHPLPVQILSMNAEGDRLHLSLATLSGDEYAVIVDAGVPVVQVAPEILRVLGKDCDTRTIRWMLHLIMPDGTLLQLHDVLK
jgi:hypothetical protein